MSWSMVVGIVASAVFLVRLLPQPARLARTGVADGVSPMAALNAVLSAIAWTIYGVEASLPIVWVVSVLALFPGIWTVWLLRYSVRRSDVVGAGAWALIIAVALGMGDLGSVLPLSVATSMGPQVVAALRGSDLTGIASMTMWVALLDAAAWGGYGMVIGDRPLALYGLVLSASAITVLLRIIRTAARAPQTVSPTPPPDDERVMADAVGV